MNGKRVVLGGLDKNIDVSTDFVTLIAHILDFYLDRVYFLHPNFLSPFLFPFFPMSASSFDSLFFLSFLTYLYLQLLSLSPLLSLSLSLCLPLSLSSTFLAQSLNTINNMLLTGCGTSRHAAELGAKIMRDLDCFDTVSVLDAAEVRQD